MRQTGKEQMNLGKKCGFLRAHEIDKIASNWQTTDEFTKKNVDS